MEERPAEDLQFRWRGGDHPTSPAGRHLKIRREVLEKY
jgi:hypothetical protein